MGSQTISVPYLRLAYFIYSTGSLFTSLYRPLNGNESLFTQYTVLLSVNVCPIFDTNNAFSQSKTNKKLFFENLTLAPIEKELINYKLLNASEKNYLIKYHLSIYSKISKYLNLKERKWLASFI